MYKYTHGFLFNNPYSEIWKRMNNYTKQGTRPNVRYPSVVYVLNRGLKVGVIGQLVLFRSIQP